MIVFRIKIYFYYNNYHIRIRIKLKFSGLVLRKLHMFYKFALSFHWRISEEKTYKVQYFLDTWHLRDVVLCPANSNAFDAQHHNKLVRIEINPRFISMQCITFHLVAHKWQNVSLVTYHITISKQVYYNMVY